LYLQLPFGRLQPVERPLQRLSRPLIGHHAQFLAQGVELAAFFGQFLAQGLPGGFSLRGGGQRDLQIIERLADQRRQFMTENLAGGFATVADERGQEILLKFGF